MVATASTKAQSNTRTQRQITKVVVSSRSEGPCLNVARTESPKLPDELRVIFPRQRLSPKTCSQRMTQFMPNTLIEHCVPVLKAEVIEINVAIREGGKWTDRVYSPKRMLWVGIIVERVQLASDRFRDESVNRPLAGLQEYSCGVKGSGHVRHRAQVHQTTTT